ncbi:TRAP transporter small permease [Carboxydochorda subterranea]|uniref:TRAP transporter small permease n=1 Tax=Carboxydichorda subterranea TaxID=3109565 RepID=A0ABZ1BVP8_9FIRM|nr:TRAP transporter small permease [Limnochorda sp. L945t]WRP16856.1 TRAP transporter small permease [Limnochorda sp. L945t]
MISRVSAEQGVARGSARAAPRPHAATLLLARALDHLEEGVVAGLLGFMVILAFANVVVRYLTTSSLAFSEELLINLFVWLSLFGAAIAVRRKAHAAVTMLVDRLPAPFRPAVRVAAYGLSLLATGLMVMQGWALVSYQRAMGVETYSMSLPMWWFSLGIPVGGVVIAIRIVEAAWKELRDGAAHQGGAGGERSS